MTEHLELGQRAIACKAWRWMPGMLSSHKARYLGADIWIDSSAHSGVYADANDGEVPDLTDSATLGCLLVLVREAYSNPGIHVYMIGSEGWCVSGARRPAYGPTEVAALVAALEAAPARPQEI